MKILMINKFLYLNGGSETYIFKLGEYLIKKEHEVQYFGMEHEGRCVGNRVNAYTSDMDFHGGSKLAKLTYPLKTIYSSEARTQLRKVLDDFQPDVCHLNNFNYQLTPSMILEIVKWRKQVGKQCKIVFTAHDYQLICPNHMMNNPNTNQNCEKCLGGKFTNCMKGKCIHGSTAKSAVGMMEAYFWKWKGVYKYIDKMICCSEFLKKKMDSNPLFAKKTITLHNFVEHVEWKQTEKKNYVLYFGRFSTEKGIETLIQVCKQLPNVPFIFAGTGPLEETINDIPNIKNVGFQKGKALEKLIREAQFSIYPSEWYENCPFSVMESQMYGTPVLGARIGGIPELIEEGRTGELFESRNVEDLKNKILGLWEKREKIEKYNKNGHKFAPGMIKLLDIDGDHKITADNDRMILGQKRPKHIFNFSNTFVYKGLDLNVVLYGTLGGMLRNAVRVNHQSYRNNSVKFDYWTPNNPTNAYPRPNRLYDNIEYESSLYYEKSDFLRVKTITLGYTLPKSLVNKATLSNCRLYVTAQNPLVFTSYTGVDPEGAATYASPSVSSWIFGMNVSF